MSEISTALLKKAFKTLDDGFKEKPNELERDGIIQRFEYTLELCWKTAKKVLAENAIDVDTPKSIFREMATIGWIESAQPWIEYIKERNKASHIYHERMAIEIFAIIPSFINDAKNLIKILDEKLT